MVGAAHGWTGLAWTRPVGVAAGWRVHTADEKAYPRGGCVTTLSQYWLRNHPELTTPEQ